MAMSDIFIFSGSRIKVTSLGVDHRKQQSGINTDILLKLQSLRRDVNERLVRLLKCHGGYVVLGTKRRKTFPFCPNSK